MWDFSKVSKPVAKKDYCCDAWPWIENEGLGMVDLSQEELGVIEKARNEKFKILSGTKYLKVVGKWEGEFTTYRARLDLQKICDDLELQLE